MVLGMKTEHDNLVKSIGKHIDKLFSKVDHLTSKLTVAESSLVIQ